MDKFILHSEYKPTGDQPQAIEALVKKGSKKAINARLYSELRALVRLLPWQTLLRG